MGGPPPLTHFGTLSLTMPCRVRGARRGAPLALPVRRCVLLRESRPGGETFLLSPSRRVPLRRHPPCPSETLSIQGQRGVDVFRPADDAAFERVQARRLEAELDERLARGGRANPRLAVHENVALARKSLDDAGHLPVRLLRVHPRQGDHLCLARRSHVEHERLPASLHPLVRLLRRDAREALGGARSCLRLLRRSLAAEAGVVDQLADWRRVRPWLEGDLVEAERHGVVQYEAAGERVARRPLAHADSELDGLGCLHGPNHAGEDAEHAPLGAGGDGARRRRLREEVAVVWTSRAVGEAQVKERELALELLDGAVH
mmetsp:Transcript_9870/g.32392  ORF Transcript_9870/g.32392 Transcript_9870/m.32392 type:complete len:317 (+) Transcript_9870:177-1127(+)